MQLLIIWNEFLIYTLAGFLFVSFLLDLCDDFYKGILSFSCEVFKMNEMQLQFRDFSDLCLLRECLLLKKDIY